MPAAAPVRLRQSASAAASAPAASAPSRPRRSARMRSGSTCMRLSVLKSDSPYLRTAAARITNSPLESQAGIESLVAVPAPNTGAAAGKSAARGAGRLLLRAECPLCRRGDRVPDADREVPQLGQEADHPLERPRSTAKRCWSQVAGHAVDDGLPGCLSAPTSASPKARQSRRSRPARAAMNLDPQRACAGHDLLERRAGRDCDRVPHGAERRDAALPDGLQCAPERCRASDNAGKGGLRRATGCRSTAPAPACRSAWNCAASAAPRPADEPRIASKAARARSANADQSTACASRTARNPIAAPIAAIAIGTAPKVAIRPATASADDAEHATERAHRGEQNVAGGRQAENASRSTPRAPPTSSQHAGKQREGADHLGERAERRRRRRRSAWCRRCR